MFTAFEVGIGAELDDIARSVGRRIIRNTTAMDERKNTGRKKHGEETSRSSSKSYTTPKG